LIDKYGGEEHLDMPENITNIVNNEDLETLHEMNNNNFNNEIINTNKNIKKNINIQINLS